MEVSSYSRLSFFGVATPIYIVVCGVPFITASLLLSLISFYSVTHAYTHQTYSLTHIMEHFTIFLIFCLFFWGSSIANGVPTTTYNVIKFGAIGDGVKDDSQAFMAAWKAACDHPASSTLTVPGEKTYLLNPTKFNGPCKARSINVEVWGNIVAPDKKSVWKDNDINTWISFNKINGLSVGGHGEGQIDGRGSVWWNSSLEDVSASARPVALYFSRCDNLQVSGMKHINSQRNHISINECNGATLSNLQITAPKTSPNTDGIDISSSTNVQVRDTNIGTGDDCIAINGGCSYINITNVACGPGHGISIGSLGANGRSEHVEEIHVQSCTFDGTINGVRIKTWQGGSGYARKISFSGITFNAVDNPIVIDQYYCPNSICKDQASAVRVSDISYSGVQGTTTKSAAVNLSCSKTIPCTNIVLDHVNITSVVPSNSTYARCINAHGRSSATIPPVNCLQQ